MVTVSPKDNSNPSCLNLLQVASQAATTAQPPPWITRWRARAARAMLTCAVPGHPPAGSVLLMDNGSDAQGSNLAWLESMRFRPQLNRLSSMKYSLMPFINPSFSKRKQETAQSAAGPGHQTPRTTFDMLRSLWDSFVFLQILC